MPIDLGTLSQLVLAPTLQGTSVVLNGPQTIPDSTPTVIDFTGGTAWDQLGIFDGTSTFNITAPGIYLFNIGSGWVEPSPATGVRQLFGNISTGGYGFFFGMQIPPANVAGRNTQMNVSYITQFPNANPALSYPLPVAIQMYAYQSQTVPANLDCNYPQLTVHKIG